MSRRVVVLLALLGVLSVLGWVLAARLDRLDGSAESAAVLTALLLGLAVVAVAADRRSPGGWLGTQTALVACVTVASVYRVFPSGLGAAVGALVWFGGALLLPELLVRYPDDQDPRTRRTTQWVCRVVPPILAVGIVVTSGPRMAGEPALRAVSWSRGGADASGVWQANPLGVLESPAALRVLTLAWGLWCLGVAVWVGRRLVTRWRRADAVSGPSDRAVALAGVLALAGTVLQVMAAYPVGNARDLSSALSVQRAYGTILYTGGVVTLPAIVAVLAWFEVVRPRLARAAGGALELGRVPADADEALARLLDDPSVRVDYRRGETWVDRSGSTVPDADADAVLVVERAGAPVARVHHDAALSDRPEELDAAAHLVGLLIDNTRLRADTMARAEEVRASGARLLEAAELVRHDVESRLERGPLALLSEGQAVLQRSDPDAAALEQLATILRDALAEVRTISHGLTPPVLAEEGLAGALVGLADATSRPVELRSLPRHRLPGPIETTAYLVVQEAVRDAPPDAALVLEVEQRDEELVVAVSGAGVPLSGPLLDRLDTLGGVVEQDAAGQVVRLPVAGASSGVGR